ncbi:hypothetical protein ABOM_004984 [Aspergillus bombycis]|uniref:CFEM domain-containing protein n=1 Tax=Aspergillus bombycis TaxID=109264 RepID=A0A1F8A557_9EURO|nr:hypothetical protein ABOM_004984 [Aspergillus bombycis]OGM46880.1 hypothetical protein ABOM_004984 [Aspergillus bombycis]
MKLSLAVSFTALVATAVAADIEQDIPQCLVNCIKKVNICSGIDIPCFCDNTVFRLAVTQCMSGIDGKGEKCSEEDQKSRFRVKAFQPLGFGLIVSVVVLDWDRSICD